MALLVQKFGGTSVGTVDRIRNVARRALATQRAGHRVVLTVSAMSGETNRLLALAHEITKIPSAREMDVIAATGEQVTAALTSMAIQAEGGQASSLLGHQVRVLTDNAFTKARILSIDKERIFEALDRGEIAVIAGFQGADEHGNITTLGRGGSDTTAVAIAAAIGADECEIYTDVDGVYTTDPNICASAQKIERISYEEMLELASLGAKVLQIRSVEIAMKYGVPVHVRTSFNDTPGTLVAKEDSALEGMVVRGVAYDKGEARAHVVGLEDRPGLAAELFEKIAEANISVDMIVQSAAADAESRAGITFTLPKSDLARGRTWIDSIAKGLGAREVRYDEDVVKVSIVGLGMRSHAGVAAKMFRLLAREGINIQAISTSEIKVSCLVASKYTELAVRALHDGFGLSAPKASV
ncbi:MAG TPA: aspartate kinase [Polyangiaceae bacterium]|nr:aspartate kinase [Polyangiaceae bacterium]